MTYTFIILSISYVLMYYFLGRFWSASLEKVIIEDIDPKGYGSRLERNIHIYLWPLSLGIFVYRYFLVMFTGGNDN